MSERSAARHSFIWRRRLRSTAMWVIRWLSASSRFLTLRSRRRRFLLPGAGALPLRLPRRLHSRGRVTAADEEEAPGRRSGTRGRVEGVVDEDIAAAGRAQSFLRQSLVDRRVPTSRCHYRVRAALLRGSPLFSQWSLLVLVLLLRKKERKKEKRHLRVSFGRWQQGNMSGAVGVSARGRT
jgi:hypothetical protein